MPTHVLDHIVHLTPPGSIELVSSEFRKLGFEVVPGGTHAGGVTYNALVSLADGVYLELIAFVDPDRDPPSSHRWASSSPGWIDFANLGLTPSGDVASVINRRAAKDRSGVVYDEGVKGGRQTPHGRTLEWRVTFPDKSAHGVGRLPFFCQDLTPREWRVPEPGNHSSTAQGISFVRILATSTDEFATLVAQFTTVLGLSMSSAATAPDSGIATWLLDTPNPIPGLQTHLILEQVAGSGKKSGIHEVGFWVKKEHAGRADSPYGKIIWTPIS